MQTRDWALVAFTLLMQSSIGTVLAATAVSLTVGRSAPWHAFDGPLAVALIAGAIALLASVLHLGHPGQAWLAVANVRASWLSREVVASLLFVASVALVVLLRLLHNEGWGAQAVAAAIGLFVVYAMARLYMVPAQAAWNTILTPLSFGGATLLLGAVVLIATADLEPEVARRVAVAAVALMVVQAAVAPLFVAGVPREPSAAVAAASVGPVAAWVTAVRIAAAVVAVVLLLYGMGPGAPVSRWLAALLFVAVSEIAGRVLFYAGSASIGPIAISGRP